jgi:hypothetical protein
VNTSNVATLPWEQQGGTAVMMKSPNDDDRDKDPELPDDDPPETPPDEPPPIPVQDPPPDATSQPPMTVARAVNFEGDTLVDRTNSPSPARDRKFSIMSALSIAAHTEGATPNNRMACGFVSLSPGISRYCSRTSCSSAASGAERGG